MPGVILNVARVRRIATFLAGLLALLLFMSMLNAIIMSIHRRRRDFAVLAALGADRRWIGRAAHWQTTILSALPLIAGVPLGIIAGSAVFRAFANRIGAVPDPTIPIALVLGLSIAFVAVANIVAVVPNLRARRVPTAQLLRAD